MMSSATFRSHREAGRVVVTVAGEVDMASLHQQEDTPGWSVQMLREPAVSPLASGTSVVPDDRTTSCNAEFRVLAGRVAGHGNAAEGGLAPPPCRATLEGRESSISHAARVSHANVRGWTIPARDAGGASAILWAWSTCPECRDRRWTG